MTIIVWNVLGMYYEGVMLRKFIAPPPVTKDQVALTEE